jgi:hypothetical protein
MRKDLKITTIVSTFIILTIAAIVYAEGEMQVFTLINNGTIAAGGGKAYGPIPLNVFRPESMSLYYHVKGPHSGVTIFASNSMDNLVWVDRSAEIVDFTAETSGLMALDFGSGTSEIPKTPWFRIIVKENRGKAISDIDLKLNVEKH